jgi:hypothetical protein
MWGKQVLGAALRAPCPDAKFYTRLQVIRFPLQIFIRVDHVWKRVVVSLPLQAHETVAQQEVRARWTLRVILLFSVGAGAFIFIYKPNEAELGNVIQDDS